MKKIVLFLLLAVTLTSCWATVREYKKPLKVIGCEHWGNGLVNDPKYKYTIDGNNETFELFSNNKYEVGEPIFLVQ